VKKDPVELFKIEALFSVACTTSFKFQACEVFKNLREVLKFSLVDEVNEVVLKLEEKFSSKDCSVRFEKKGVKWLLKLVVKDKSGSDDRVERFKTEEVWKVFVKRVSCGSRLKLDWLPSKRSSKSFSASDKPVVELVNQL
jgi:hypothetical protein|tara:strand:- start:1579 stop:1998 length:420 start_codon:yes stop_codon:yes gene_type:complete